VNLILFEAAEINHPLPRTDRRARHILEVLRRKVGDTFDAAIINGRRGKATLTAMTADALTLTFAGDASPPPALPPITLIVGLPRPQTARDILRDATTLGVAAIHFVRTDKSEPSYAQSTLWSNGEWRRHALAGAEQAFDPRLPEITHDRLLTDILPALPAALATTRIALDNYESPAPLSQIQNVTYYVTLAIGAERGWSAEERELLRRHGFGFAHLGNRVLRTETACVAALAIVRARMGLM
jgi:16S rRNA (uracil1498-N3)-methyltransferase